MKAARKAIHRAISPSIILCIFSVWFGPILAMSKTDDQRVPDNVLRRSVNGPLRPFTFTLQHGFVIAQDPTLQATDDQETTFDLISEAPRAVWSNQVGRLLFVTTPRNDEPADNRGFITYRDNRCMEDNRGYDRVLETHPRWDTHNPNRRSLGMIRGEYYIPAIKPGQHFVARAGFLAYYPSPNTNGVGITVWYNNTLLFKQVKLYDGTLLHIDEDLSQFAGKSGLLTIEVDTNGDSTQDWLSWIEAYIGAPKAEVVGSEGGCGL